MIPFKQLRSLTETANLISSGKLYLTEARQSHNDVITAAKLAKKWDKMYKGKKLSIKKIRQSRRGCDICFVFSFGFFVLYHRNHLHGRRWMVGNLENALV